MYIYIYIIYTFIYIYIFIYLVSYLIEGSLEVKFPTIWTHENQGWEEAEKKGRRERQNKEDAGAQKGSKVAKHCVFPMVPGPKGSKVRSLKRRVQSHLAR